MSKPKTTNPNAIVRPRMLASTRDRLQELSAELSEDSYEGQRLVIEMAERAAVHMRDCQIAESAFNAISKENRTLKAKLESSQKCYAIAEDGRLKALELVQSQKAKMITCSVLLLSIGVVTGGLAATFL